MAVIDRLGKEPLLIEVAPITEYDAYGRAMDNAVIGEEFKSAPHTIAQQASKQIAKTAYGDVTIEEAEKLLSKNVRPFQHFNDGKGVVAHGHLGREELPTRILPAGKEIDLPQAKEAELQRMNKVQMAKWLQGWLQHDYDPSMLGELSKRFPDGATEPELEQVLADLRAGRTASGKARLQAV